MVYIGLASPGYTVLYIYYYHLNWFFFALLSFQFSTVIAKEKKAFVTARASGWRSR